MAIIKKKKKKEFGKDGGETGTLVNCQQEINGTADTEKQQGFFKH